MQLIVAVTAEGQLARIQPWVEPVRPERRLSLQPEAAQELGRDRASAVDQSLLEQPSRPVPVLVPVQGWERVPGPEQPRWRQR